ncbi:uncharacterized protein LOC108114461 [Drosophila eugracilis]|uniref:uncharacterized protein LOC108114461 n=1 Tax=Drosophila eugracilis TaxID=29029 RepID=UPI0007E7D5BC|nr:uncharacterized protein LOC108114461 [Drosophila eugracilis]
MDWTLALLLYFFASVKANGRQIQVNTSTSGMTDAEGGTLVPGPGFFQETRIGNVPYKPGPPLKGLGNGIVVISESKQSKNGELNIVNSKVQTVTEKPIGRQPRRMWNQDNVYPPREFRPRHRFEEDRDQEIAGPPPAFGWPIQNIGHLFIRENLEPKIDLGPLLRSINEAKNFGKYDDAYSSY